MSRITVVLFHAFSRGFHAARKYIPALIITLNTGILQAAEPNGTVFNGAVSGEFSVSPAGAATYSIPIEVPPGIGDLQPALSLEYNSQAGNGLLGVGWSLSGLSAITRCSTTLAQDDFIDPVDFDSNDRYCLDGQRLIQLGNSGCAGGSEYRTEIDSFARICSYGAQGSGPLWFRMWSKAGQIMDYGNTQDSRVEAQGRTDVLVWALSRVSDTVGNYLEVAYHEDASNGEYYPLRIDYAGNVNEGMAPYHAVHFLYEQRSDTSSGWIAGSKLRSSMRMTNIQVWAGLSVMRDIRLGYEASEVSGRSRLASVGLCVGEEGTSDCTSVMNIGWSSGSASYSLPVSMEGVAWHAMDVNGDGMSDIVSCADQYSTWRIQLSNGEGMGSPIDTGVECTYQYHSATEIDYDGDGRMDLIVPGTFDSYPWVWYVLKSTGTGFVRINTVIPNDILWEYKPEVMDVNGDGRQDFVVAYYDYDELKWKGAIWINTGVGFDMKPMTGIDKVEWDSRKILDYDADGRQDLLVLLNGKWQVLRSTGEAFDVVNTSISKTAYENLAPLVLDINGDGLGDIVGNTSTARVVYLNTGSGFGGPSIWASGVHWLGGSYRVDYNGDGQDDIIMFGRPDSASPTNFHVLQSADASFDVIDTGVPSSSYNRIQNLVDFNGDGKADLLLRHNSSFFVMRQTEGLIDQVVSIDNGIGGTTEVRYEPLTSYDGYSDGLDPSYPHRRFNAPLYIVSATVSSDGVGGEYRKKYTYADARIDLRGRGFLGFGITSVIDEETRIKTLTSYHQDFPLSGRASSVKTTLIESGVTLAEQEYGWGSQQLVSGVFQVWIETEVEIVRELNGETARQVTTTYSPYDSFGNPLRVDVFSTGGTNNHKYTENTYTNDVNSWHLGRLIRSTITSVTPTHSETRTSAFEYDPLTGLLSAEIIEPEDPALLLRRQYAYDGYGNKSSVTIHDSGGNEYSIPASSSTTSYDYSQLASYGTYTITSTNAKGHAESRVIDAGNGKPLKLTGPNGLITQWVYDGFGRQVKEIRSDATVTETEMIWCDEDCAGIANVTYKVIARSTGDSPTAVYYDGFHRELRSEAVNLSGRPIYKDAQYNHLGQKSRQSRPYLADDLSYWVEYHYDDAGRVWKERNPDGGILEATYNGLASSMRRYSINDSYDQTVTKITDVNGNLLRVVDEGNQVTTYEYDAFDNLIRVTDPLGNVTEMTYDRRGRKLTMNEPNMGVWEYRYDALGQLRWQKDAKGQVMTMTYDELGRVLSKVQPEGAASWTYDNRPRGIGKLGQVKGVDGYIERHYYDSYGRPRQVRKIIDGTTLTTTKAYDAQGRVSRLIYPSGFAVRYLYNGHGHLHKVVNSAKPSEYYWEAQDMDGDGNITSESMGNGLSTARYFDPASGRLLQLGTYHGFFLPVQMLNYTYDSLGNLKSRNDPRLGLSESFQYDEFNRLTEAHIVGVGVKRWSYDVLGNITEKNGHVYTYGNGRPHAVSSARGNTYNYDANGNLQLTFGAINRYIFWNSENRPAWIWADNNRVDFNYAPDGARYRQVSVSSSGVTVTTLYAGPHHEQVTKDGVTIHKDYITVSGRVVAIREMSGSIVEMKYLHQDHLGSTDVITDAAGMVLERQSFDPFGTRRAATDWSDPAAALTSLVSSRGFTGHEQLDGVELIHMNGRVYDPQLGRFLSADPYVGAPANPQNLNRYSYVNNNPLSYTDPSGYFLKKVFKKIARVVKKIVNNPIVRAVAAIVAAPVVGLLVGASLGLSTAAGYAISGFTAGFIASGGNLQAGLIGAATGLGFYGVGNLAQAGNWGAARTSLAHGAVGGASNLASGGKFGPGFMSGGFTSFSSPLIGKAPGDWVGRTMAAAAVGGTASEIGGGKFANGALTGAFSRLFNHEIHSDEYVYKGEEKVLRPTGRSRIEWEGLENIKWRELHIDGVLETFIRRPLPPMSVRLGVEYGFRTYEHLEGVQPFQYSADSSSFGGGVSKTPLGPIQWSERTVWQPIKHDTTVFTRRRFGACVAQTCY